MPRFRVPLKLVCAAIALAVGLSTAVDISPTSPAGIVLAPKAAEAATRGEARRVSRRTSRRTTRRQNYINSLPPGCPRSGAYYYCGGVYYAPQVQNGATVYVIVNP